MRTGLLSGIATAAFAGMLLACPAAAQAPGQASAWTTISCDHACLVGYLHRYMDALVHKDPSRAPFARAVTLTENDVAMPIGEGLWGSISDASADGLEVADPTTGQAAWFDQRVRVERVPAEDHPRSTVEPMFERLPDPPRAGGGRGQNSSKNFAKSFRKLLVPGGEAER